MMVNKNHINEKRTAAKGVAPIKKNWEAIMSQGMDGWEEERRRNGETPIYE